MMIRPKWKQSCSNPKPLKVIMLVAVLMTLTLTLTPLSFRCHKQWTRVDDSICVAERAHRLYLMCAIDGRRHRRRCAIAYPPCSTLARTNVTQAQIHKHKNTNTNTQAQTLNASTQVQIHKHKYTSTNTQSSQLPELNWETISNGADTASLDILLHMLPWYCFIDNISNNQGGFFFLRRNGGICGSNWKADAHSLMCKECWCF